MDKIMNFARSLVRPYWAFIAGIAFLYLVFTGGLDAKDIMLVIGVVIAFYFQSRQTDKLLAEFTELQKRIKE